MGHKVKVFLASSSELLEDRKEFEIFLGRRNKVWASRGITLELVAWDDFLDVMSKTRLQEEYNQVIKACDLFVMLFCTKVGPYTEEEFDTAFGHFQATDRPYILTYFKDDPTRRGQASRQDMTSLWAFQDKLKTLGHFQTGYPNIEGLKLHFSEQLEKLVAQGSIAAKPDAAPAVAPGGGPIYQGPVHQGQGHIIGGDHVEIVQNFAALPPQPGPTEPELRRAYLEWLGVPANELPLFAGDAGDPLRLSAIYTALMTQGGRATVWDGRNREGDAPERAPLSALEALDECQYLVLMGGPGSGKSTFLNFVALCMAGELLDSPDANLALLRSPVPREEEDDKEPKPQRWRHKALLPVRVILRDFAASLPRDTEANADHLWDFIASQLPGPLKGHAPLLQQDLLLHGGLMLLDGLDEVPEAHARRGQIKQAVEGFAQVFGRCRFLVTSRTYAYQKQDWKLKGFAETELLPFNRGQIERFVETWYAHMAQTFRLNESDAQALAEALKRDTLSPHLRELAQRPLLLTLMARLQTMRRGPLPENREELYKQSVDMLLEQWEGFKVKRDRTGQVIGAEQSLGAWLDASRESIRRELDKLAYVAHLNQPELVGTADIRQADLIAALLAASPNPDFRPQRVEEYLRDRAGLLNSHGVGLYQFPHRSFQEYLAACHLARFKFPDELGRLVKGEPERWREILLLAAARTRDAPSALWDLVATLCSRPVPERQADAQTQWGALLAGQVLVETSLARHDPDLQERHEEKRLLVRDWQLNLLGSAILPPRERALAGDHLAILGDTRDWLLDVDQMRFCAVPGGPFWMGKDAELHLNESLAESYWMGLAPVTVAQFRQYLTETGRTAGDGDALGDPDNRPVRYVSWHEAQVFSAWLDARWRDRLPKGWQVALPTEAQWEKAARGGLQIPAESMVLSIGSSLDMPTTLDENPLPQHAWPWGDDSDANKLNADSNVGTTSTPGCFSLGHSPYGCEDMAGNVWEWTGSEEDKYRLVRGGSWGNDRDDARCALRYGVLPADRDDYLGFRVVLCSSPV